MMQADRRVFAAPRFPPWSCLLATLLWTWGIAMWQVEMLPLWLMWLVIPCFFLLLFRRCRGFVALFFIACLWGGAALLWSASQVTLPDELLAKPLWIEADIVAIQQQYPMRLTLAGIQHEHGSTLSGRIWVYVYKHHAALRIGQRIRLSVTLHQPRNRQNPGGFNFISYCFVKHISALGHSSKPIRILTEPVSMLQLMRARVIERLSLLADEQRGVLQALLLGERQYIPLPIQEAFSASGAAHLLAISGLHIGMLSAWVFFLSWWCLTRFEISIVYLPVRATCLLAALLACVLYATLAAWPIPAQRAVLMLAVFVVACWMRQRHLGLHALCVAWCLILLFDPSSISSISLWLSFVAAWALLMWAGNPSEKKKRNALSALLWVSVICFLVTLPFVVHAFARLPVYSLLMNIILVPLFSLWILPTALLGELAALLYLPHVADWFFQLSAYVLSWSNEVLLLVYHWPGGNLWLAEKNKVMSIVYAIGLCISFVLFSHAYKRKAALVLSFNLLLYSGYLLMPIHPQMQWVVWDVGQGSAATFVSSQGDVLHVDVPGKPNKRFNAGTTVASGLRTLGVTHVDVLVLSHAQQDHIGGSLRLFDQLNHVKELWLADVSFNRQHKLMQRIIQKAQQQGTVIRWLSQGQHRMLGETSIRVLWPPRDFKDANRNQLSLVLSVRTAQHTFLLAGDIESQVENRLLDAGVSAHDVLLMPHHGSQSSNTQAWVEQLAPRIAIAQTGYKNRYAFPANQVVQRYVDQGAEVWNTAQGAVLISVRDRELKLQQWHLAHAQKQQLALQWWQGDL